MNVVDSCGWLEYFANDVNAGFFEPILLDTTKLLVPSICIFEVSRRLLHWGYAQQADNALMLTTKGKVIDLSPAQLFAAAQAAKRYQLAMADAIIWQTAREHNAVLYTQDAAFKDLPSVNFKAKTN